MEIIVHFHNQWFIFLKNLLVRDNINIHLIFRLCNNLLSFVSNNLVSLHESKYLLSEKDK